MAISTNQKPTIYRNLFENTGPGEIKNDPAIFFSVLVNLFTLVDNSSKVIFFVNDFFLASLLVDLYSILF